MPLSDSTTQQVSAVSAGDLSRLQRRRKQRLVAGGVAIAAFSLVTQSLWQPGSTPDIAIEIVGVVLIVLCALGRAWSILYIGGRKTKQLITEGPYSITRNPLYLFTFVGAFGLGLQLGNLFSGLLYLLVTVAVFVPVMRTEEKALASRFGSDFETYRQTVPLVLPRVSRWHDPATLTFSTGQLYKSLRDSLILLSFAPLVALIDLAQMHGYLPVLLRLP